MLIPLPTDSCDIIGSRLESVVRKIPVYKNCSITLEYQVIPTKKCKFLVKSVLEGRFGQANELVNWLVKGSQKAFSPGLRSVAPNDFRLVVPPVVEYSDSYYVMDGSHRIFAAYQMGVGEIGVYVVKGSNLPIHASRDFTYEQLNIVEDSCSFFERVESYNHDYFRPVVLATRYIENFELDSSSNWIKSLDNPQGNLDYIHRNLKYFTTNLGSILV